MNGFGEELSLTRQTHLVEFIENVLFEPLHFRRHFIFRGDVEIDVHRRPQVFENFDGGVGQGINFILREVKAAQTLPRKEPVGDQANAQTQGDRDEKGVAGRRTAANVEKEPVEKQKDCGPDEEVQHIANDQHPFGKGGIVPCHPYHLR